MSFKTTFTVATLATLAGTSAYAAHLSYYGADFVAINGSGVTGSAKLTYDDIAKTLDVHVTASGLAPDQVHIQHIHGIPGGDSTSPTLADDADGDGFVELAEAFPNYGPIMLSLTSDASAGLNGFPTAPGGIIDFFATYNLLTTNAFGLNTTTADPNDAFDIADLIPTMLENRELVIHGGWVPFGVGDGTPGEVNGSGGYALVLPVATAEIYRTTGPAPSPVPLPAAGFLLLGGLGGLSLFKRRKAA